MAFFGDQRLCIIFYVHVFLLWRVRSHSYEREHSPINQDAPVLRSCWELKLGGYTRDGEYMIDPDGHQRGQLPFTVYCDMRTGTSIIYHDRQNRGIVPKGFEEKGNYRAPVNYYGATVQQLSGLADVSGNCSQFISLECQNVLMRWRGDPWTYWVSRDGVEMGNWGTPTGTPGCQCGIDETCAKKMDGEGVNRCNCDANDGTWRRDTGTLTDKRTIPVKEMRFGDSQGSQELALYRLGEFKCTGKDSPLFRSCEVLGKAGFAPGTYLLNNSVVEDEELTIGERRTYPRIVECAKDYEPQGAAPTDMASCADLRQAGYRKDGIYKIDPDGSGKGVAQFEVQCYLSTSATPPIMKSCADLLLAGYSINKDYIIDPDGPHTGVEPFVVYCDLTTGTTTVGHNQAPLRPVPFGYEEEGEYRVPIHYEATMDQMVALIGSSRICRQYLSLDCHHVLIWHGDVMITWWVSRDGEKMTNWASDTGTVGCACSKTNSCGGAQRRCNCDTNDMIWRRDDGFITDQSKLPISELRIADTGHLPEQVFYTIGSMQCSGFDSKVSKSSITEGKPLTKTDDRPSSTPSEDKEPVKKTQTSDCSKNSTYSGLVVGIILMLIVIFVLLVIIFFIWRNNKRLQRSGFIYKSGAI